MIAAVDQPIAAGAASSHLDLLKDENGRTPAGLRGYLIYLFLYLALFAAGSAAMFVMELPDSASFAALAPLEKAIAAASIIVHALLFVPAPLALLALAARKSDIFPGLTIVWAWTLPAVSTLWAFFGYLLGSEGWKGFIGPVVLLCIAAATIASYLNNSIRVQNTFLR